MPNWFDRLMEDATTPHDGGRNEGEPKQGNAIIRLAKNEVTKAVIGFQNDVDLPIGIVVGRDERGNPVLVRTGKEKGPGVIRRSLNGLITDTLLPHGYVMGVDEEGNPAAVEIERTAGVSIATLIKKSVKAELTPDVVSGTTSALAGLFRDLNSPIEEMMTQDEYDARMANAARRKEIAAKVGSVAWSGTKKIGGALAGAGRAAGGFIFEKAVDAATAGSSWATREAAKAAASFVRRRQAQRAAKE